MLPDNRQMHRGTPQQKLELGRAIASARVGKGLEQEDLGRLIGRTQTWVSRTEAGIVTLSAFEYARVAEVLEIPAEVLLRLAWLGIPRP